MVLFYPGEVLPWDFFRGGGGGGLPYGIISTWGSSAMGFLPGGEGLLYGIPLWGMFAIWYNFPGGQSAMVFVSSSKHLCGGEIYHRGESFTIWYCPPWGSSAIGFIPGERLPYGIISGG